MANRRADRGGNGWRLSVVTPFYNEGEALGTYFDAVISELAKVTANWEIIAVDDVFSFSVIPIRFITIIGLLLSVVFFSYGLYMIYNKLVFDAAVAGYTSTIVAILFLGGVQLTAIGIIGEYVGRIYNESKRRPIYVVDELQLGGAAEAEAE